MRNKPFRLGLDHLGNHKIYPIILRRIVQGSRTVERGIDQVLTGHVLELDCVRGGGDVSSVQFTEFVHVTQDTVHLFGHAQFFSFGQFEARKDRDVPNFLNTDFILHDAHQP